MQAIVPTTGRLTRLRAALTGIGLATGLALALSATAQAQNDRVILKNGKADKAIRIKSEDLDGVWYAASGGAGNAVIKWNEIDSIQYASGDAYQAALDTLTSGRAADAAGQFEKLAGEAELRPVLKQNVLFHLALADMRLGKNDDALARFKELLTGFPKCRYLLPVGSALLSIYIAKNDVAGAAAALDPVLAVAKDASADPSLQAALGVLRARLLEEQKKLNDAVSAYEATVRNPKAEPDVINAAKLGLARCAQQNKQLNDAETKYRELVKLDAPNTLLAGAWNGLADLAFAQAFDKHDPDGLRVALLSYMRGIVVYVPGPGESSDETERALAGASLAAKAIGELEGNAERKQLYLSRARDFRKTLTDQYPGSRYLK